MRAGKSNKKKKKIATHFSIKHTNTVWIQTMKKEKLIERKHELCLKSSFWTEIYNDQIFQWISLLKCTNWMNSWLWYKLIVNDDFFLWYLDSKTFFFLVAHLTFIVWHWNYEKEIYARGYAINQSFSSYPEIENLKNSSTEWNLIRNIRNYKTIYADDIE